MCPSYWQKKKKIYNWPVFSQWLVKGSSTVQASRSRCSCNHVAPNRCADHVTGGPLIDKQSFRHARINYPFFPGPGARTMQASLQAFANSVQRTSTQLKPAPTNTEEIETRSRKESERKKECGDTISNQTDRTHLLTESDCGKNRKHNSVPSVHSMYWFVILLGYTVTLCTCLVAIG
jgi:hypothetical protein